MRILYGGAFNPPTVAHLAIIKYLIRNYKDAEIILLPAGSSYKTGMAPYNNRKEMLKIMTSSYKDRINISDYENSGNEFRGTYYTLQDFGHPYFVIGADQVTKLEKWIKFPEVVSENKFIVFPRDEIDAKSYIENNKVLTPFLGNFSFIKNFKLLSISSSEYRNFKNDLFVTKRINNYIKKNQLY